MAPARSKSKTAARQFEENPELFAALREWRLKTAKQRKVPAFTVMHDRSLEELCRARPQDLAALRRVHGFGERKTAMYGDEILAVLLRFRPSKRQAGGSARHALQ